MNQDRPVRRLTLPNGMNVAYQVKPELLQFYDDIFEKQIYTKNGITLREGDCVFDVGANIGMFTVYAAWRWPRTRIFSFEPVPALFAILKENAAWCDAQVTLFNCALSDHAGTADLTFYPNTSGMSSFYPNEEEERAALRTLIHNELTQGKSEVESLLRYEDELVEQRLKSETVTCELRTLSSVIREHGIERIDLLKVDVEKAELDVLAGIEEADWRKIEQAVLEVHDLEGRIEAVTRLFQSHGFAVQLEQDELYKGSDRYNLYALRERVGAIEGMRSGDLQRRRPDRAAALGKAESRAQRMRELMQKGRGPEKG
jgi:phthiocerol/phenolphthiocerol synthesis type-I polyketide synthase E